MTDYSVTTTNATNKVMAVAADKNATIQIMNGETEIANGSSATWATGENTLTVKVTNGSAETIYNVTVTKS